ncbi:MAG: glycosyltransferase family 1 protein [Isosphaeraceae bacterium]
MKVAFNAALLHYPSLRGWNRYTVNLLAELPALGVEPLLYLTHPIHEHHLDRLPEDTFPVRVAPPMRNLQWEQRWLARQCGVDRVDLFHCPLNYGLPWASSCPKVLTLHDAIDDVFYRPRSSWKSRLNPGNLRIGLSHWIARTRADQVITVSEHAKGDLHRHLGIPEARITVTHEAADPLFHEPISDETRAEVRRRHGLADRPYVFYVGGWEQRKNVPFLVKGFAEAALDGVDLVLAGGNDDQRAALIEQARSLGLDDSFRLLGWIDEADMPALYAEALCFVYPSEYEGFGLQLCEAMATGCPTLAARATCLPEILGQGGDTFTLDQTEELAALLRRVAGDPDYRRDLAARARARIADFSWRKTAEETVAVYERAIRDRG